jgi:hypothetical protein
MNENIRRREELPGEDSEEEFSPKEKVCLLPRVRWKNENGDNPMKNKKLVQKQEEKDFIQNPA